MNVGELKEMLDEFGDHIDVLVVWDTGKEDRVFTIEDVDLRGGEVRIEVQRTA